MKAITFREFGGPEVLQATEVERPEPGPDDVLVRIHAAGICYHDVLSRGGKIPGKPGRILGHEIAGEIVEAGANVAPERVGERVVIYQRLFCGALPLLPRRPAGPVPQQPRAGRERRRRLCRVHLRAGAQRHPDAGRSRHDGGGARGLSGRHQRARGARRRAYQAGRDRADHRRGRRARAASDPGGEERAGARHRRHQFGGQGRVRSARPAPTRSSSART